MDATTRTPGFFGPAAPVVVGHRGTGPGSTAPGYRENTVPAFLRAVERGAAWVECDAQASADGVPLLRHDTAGDGLVVADHRRAELATQALDALADLHAALPAHVGIDVEVKVGLPDERGEDPSTRCVLELVAAHRAERPWLVSSFDPTAVLAARRAGLPAGWLTGPGIALHESVAVASRLDAQVACVHAAAVLTTSTTALPVAAGLELARRRGLTLLAWGATPQESPALAAAGVAALCVDDVGGTAAVLGGTRAGAAAARAYRQA